MLTADMDIEKYLRKDKKKRKKKNYTLYLDEDVISSLKKDLNVSLSFIVNDFLTYINKKIQKEEKEKQDTKTKKNENGK